MLVLGGIENHEEKFNFSIRYRNKSFVGKNWLAECDNAWLYLLHRFTNSLLGFFQVKGDEIDNHIAIIDLNREMPLKCKHTFTIANI